MFSKYAWARGWAPCRLLWTTCRMDRHWLYRGTRASKCVQRPTKDCSSPETYTSSPARMMTSNVPWWSASRGCCRAWFITTWCPTGPGVLRKFCRPCCALITPHITAPLAWHHAPWTRPLQSKTGTPVLATMSTMLGRPVLTATCIWQPGQDEQDPSPVHQGLLGSLVQGDLSHGSRARHQSCDQCHHWCWGWTNQGAFLWPRTPESHATRLLWRGINLGNVPVGKRHRVPG